MRVPLDPDVAMPLRHSRLRLLALAIVVISGTAQAKRDEPARLDLPANATTAQFAEQRGQIEAAIKDAEAYAELRASDRRQVRESLDRMNGQIEVSGSLAALSDADRKALLAQQEDLNAVLKTAHGDSRMVCKREKEIGSNFRRTVCMTVAQRRRMSEQAQIMGLPQS